MANYYILKPAVDTKETGNAYPAVESYDDYDFNAPNSVHKIKFNEFPDFTPDIHFKLAKGARLCDMMGQATISGHGFLISEKLKSVFEKANIIPHKFYPATIEANGTLHKYYWVHFAWKDAHEKVDFPKSKFYIRKFSSKLENISLLNFNDYLEEKEKIGTLKTIDFTELSVKPIAYDMFLIPFRGEIFVNENFKSLLNNSNLTGIELEPTTKINTVLS
jgi:hypothetical protein